MKTVISNNLKLALSLVLFVGLGALVAKLGLHLWPSIKQQIFAKPLLYSTTNEELKASVASAKITALNWSALLPEKEHQIIADYQAPPAQKVNDITAQIMRSIKASSDKDYQQALNSTNTVVSLDGKIISISGFIVPIDFYPDKSLQHLFIVPYFGACLHFPAPPPNQIIFTKLQAGFTEFDINQAYTLTGKMELGLFEDPMGTSAYILETASIEAFYGQPDDFRQH